MSGKVWKREDGTWCYRVAIGKKADGTVNRRQRNNFATKKAADIALDELMSDYRAGDVVASTNQTLAEYLDSWLIAKEPSIRPTTFAQYETSIRTWVIPNLPLNLKLVDVEPRHIQNLYTHLAKAGRKDGKGLAPRSIEVTHRALNQALAQAVAWRTGLKRNPCAAENKIIRPRKSTLPAPAWGPLDAKKFLEANKNHRLYPLFVVMISTGLRRGEALGLRWENVDFDARRLTVLEARVSLHGKSTVSEVKTRSGVRQVNLNPDVLAILAKHRANTTSTSDHVFTGLHGLPIHPQNFRRDIVAACKRAGLAPLTPKGFRHTAATVALKSGVHPKKVQEMLGHANLTITMDVYSHLIEGMDRDASDAMGVALFDHDEEGDRR